ncbi:MAG: dephospho-CoA kinase [Planctomycetaceae bacterium]|nr:dephospho-CoA kinase [Planctomycetaceae bacterium]
MKLIGIVGGIASGKSFVSRAFQDLGAKWIDADAMVHEAYRLPSVLHAISQRWGTHVLDQQGNLDRRQVASIVFASNPGAKSELAWLEALVHPLVAEQIEDQLEQWRLDPSIQVVVLDAPVLIQAGWDRLCDKLIFVDADETQRMSRAQARGWTREEWQRRESLQTSLEEKLARSTWSIDNNGSPADTLAQVRMIWKSLVSN